MCRDFGHRPKRAQNSRASSQSATSAISAAGSRAANGRPRQNGQRAALGGDRPQSHLVAETAAHHGAQFADAVDEPALDRHSAGQDLAGEQGLVGRVDLAGAAAAHVLLEGAVDILLQPAQSRDIGRIFGQERVEQRLVRPGGVQAALDAEPVDQPGKAETRR